MWVFERPALLLLLLALGPAIYFRHFWKGRGGKIVFPFAIWNQRGFRPPASVASMVVAGGAVAFWFGLAFFIVAMAGPEVVTREQVFITRGIDIVIALDQSPTMAANDFQPENRFESAKEIIERFVSGRENDPIGLVGFGREASLRVPPTLDYDHLLAVLRSMQVWELGDGTAIGMGLAVAALHLSQSSAPRKVIILLTDGVNNSGEILPETAAEAARNMGIQVYVVGIGTERTVEFEAVNPETGERQRGTFSGGFDQTLLQAVADAGDGAYFFAGSNGALISVFNAIDTVERLEQRSLLRVHREPRFQLLLIVGLILVFFDFIARRVLFREVL